MQLIDQVMFIVDLYDFESWAACLEGCFRVNVVVGAESRATALRVAFTWLDLVGSVISVLSRIAEWFPSFPSVHR